MPAVASSLRITEIFCSLQGESSLVGWPTVFVRLTGCPLRCGYCDTTYSFTGGETLGMDDILDTVNNYQVRHVCVTGGEPLAQKNCLDLLTALCNLNYIVSLETSGAIDIEPVDKRVKIIMDIKTPASGESEKNRWDNLQYLTEKDEIKFVLASRDDFDWAVERIRQYGLDRSCEVLMSPVHDELAPTQLADWILEQKLDVRFQLQLHKLLWGDRPGV